MANRRAIDNETVDRLARDAALTPDYLLLMAISGVLSAVALLTNSVPLLLGAMIIAPVLSPLALVSFALVGDRPRLALSGILVATLGLVMAVGFAMLTTFVVQRADLIRGDIRLLELPLLEERVRPGWYSVIAAVAAGIAGTLALHRGKMDTLIGTVASVALVPAGGAAAIAAMERDTLRALGGVVLLVVNAGVIIAVGLVVLLLLSAGRQSDSR